MKRTLHLARPAGSSGSNWYRAIEPGIRRYVKLLRDNGFNTTSSCEHRMEVTLYDHGTDVDRLDALLRSRGFRDFVVMLRLERRNGQLQTCAVVQFGGDRVRERISRRHRSLVSWWWEAPPPRAS